MLNEIRMKERRNGTGTKRKKTKRSWGCSVKENNKERWDEHKIPEVGKARIENKELREEKERYRKERSTEHIRRKIEYSRIEHSLFWWNHVIRWWTSLNLILCRENHWQVKTTFNHTEHWNPADRWSNPRLSILAAGRWLARMSWRCFTATAPEMWLPQMFNISVKKTKFSLYRG